jgi:hypothetical protein
VEKAVHCACDSELSASAVECAYCEVEEVPLKLSFYVHWVLSADLERVQTPKVLELVEGAQTDGVVEELFKRVQEALRQLIFFRHFYFFGLVRLNDVQEFFVGLLQSALVSIISRGLLRFLIAGHTRTSGSRFIDVFRHFA